MNALTLALYDIETSNNPFPTGREPMRPLDEIGFAVGIVRFVTFVRRPTGDVTRARRCENVHFGPVPMLDDLLRPWAHAVVGFNALHFDNPVLVASAVWPEPGIYLGIDATQAEISAHEEQLQAYGIGRGAAKYIANLDPGLVSVFLDRLKLTREHSKLIVPGAVGIAAKREHVLEALNARTLDPLAELARLTGHPHVAKLEYFRDLGKVAPFEIDGQAVTGAEVPGMWQDGRVWDVVAKCRNDLDVLEELVHHALWGGDRAELRTKKLNRYYTGEHGETVEVPIDAWENPTAGAEFRYRLPTGDWWDRLVSIARSTR